MREHTSEGLDHVGAVVAQIPELTVGGTSALSMNTGMRGCNKKRKEVESGNSDNLDFACMCNRF